MQDTEEEEAKRGATSDDAQGGSDMQAGPQAGLCFQGRKLGFSTPHPSAGD